MAHKGASTAPPPHWPLSVTIAVFIIAFFGVANRIVAVENAQAYRATFLDAAIRGCSEDRVRANESAGVSSDGVIAECKCKAEAMTTALSSDQMSRLTPGKALPPDILAIERSSIAKCSSDLKSGE